MKKITSCLRETYCLFLKQATKCLASFCLLAVFATSALANENKTIGIGEKLPELRLVNVLNDNDGTLDTSDMKGKLVILDFWATWCGPCIAMMPEEDSLQREFGTRIMILPVTSQSTAEITGFFKRAKRLQSFKLPVVTADTLLANYFPHKQLPHYVWINGEGVVMAITGAEEVKAGNIRSFLESTKVALAEKKDVMIDYHAEIPLLFGTYGFTQADITFETVFSNYRPGLPCGYAIRRDPDKSINRITATNASIEMLAQLAWCDNRIYFNRNNTFLTVSDPDKVRERLNVTTSENQRWLFENTFCYELILPESMRPQAFAIMQQDFNRLFPQYKAKVEKRKVKSLVLVRTSSVDKMTSKGGAWKFEVDHFQVEMSNAFISTLVSALGSALELNGLPVVDGTSYKSRVDMVLTANLRNVGELKKSLIQYDLDLVERVTELDVLDITDSK